MIKIINNNYKVLLGTALIIMSMLLVIYVLRPAIVGYIAYQKAKSLDIPLDEYGKDISELKTDIKIRDANLSVCYDLNKKFLGNLNKFVEDYSDCRAEVGSLRANYSLTLQQSEIYFKTLINQLDEENKKISEELKLLKEQKDLAIDELKNNYELLAKNTAINLCCKAKVDNPKINYYKIENNKVLCLEDGTLPISC